MTRNRFDRRDLAAVAAGGVVGAALRWALARAGGVGDRRWLANSLDEQGNTLVDAFDFPWPTFVANVVGCVALGAVLRWRQRDHGSPRLLLAAGTGFCGSLTTFSTFALEVAHRVRGRALVSFPLRDSTGALTKPAEVLASGPAPVWRALFYAAVSILAGGLAFWAGRAIATRYETTP